MNIKTCNWKNWVVEEKITTYPWTEEKPLYFACPIWQKDNWELETRRAGANYIKWDSKEYTWYNEKEIKEIKRSMWEFVELEEKLCKWPIEETILYRKILQW